MLMGTISVKQGYYDLLTQQYSTGSLRGRRVKNLHGPKTMRGERGKETRDGVSLSLARISRALYFHAPATQATPLAEQRTCGEGTFFSRIMTIWKSTNHMMHYVRYSNI